MVVVLTDIASYESNVCVHSKAWNSHTCVQSNGLHVVHGWANKSVVHGGLTKEQSDLLESIQKRALRIIIPDIPCSEALDLYNMESLSDRRRNMCLQVFTQMQNPDHKPNNLLPPKREEGYNLRNRKPLCPHNKCNNYNGLCFPLS